MRSDVDSGQYHVAVMTDDQGDATGLSVYEREGEAGKTFTLEEMRLGKVLMQARGRSVITLVGPELTQKEGGGFSLVYLKNGITGSVVNFVMQLRRLGDRWALYTAKNRGEYAFSHLFLHGNRKAFVGLIGISWIETN
jgi:hypothetical protein